MDTFTRASMTRRSVVGASCIAVATLAATTPTMPARAADPWLAAAEIVARIKVPAFPARDFRITDYGAVGNATTDCTAAMISRGPAVLSRKLAAPAPSARISTSSWSNVVRMMTLGAEDSARTEAVVVIPS